MINAVRPGALTRRAFVGGAGAGVMAGCASADPHRLTLWAMSIQGENVPRVLPAFEHATGIKVDVQALPWTAAHEKLLTAYAGGSLPDVLMVRGEWMAELAMLGALAPVSAAAGLMGDQFPPVLAIASVGGRAYGVPWIVDSWVQYYRRDLLADLGYEAPPTRWDDWLTMARARRRRHPDRFTTLMLLDWPEPLINFAIGTGEPPLRDRNARGNFRSPGFGAALAFYKQQFDERLAPAIVGTQVGDSLASFAAGEFAILPSTAETVGDLGRRAAALPRARWSVARTPGPAGPARTFVAGSSLAVSSTAHAPDHAWALVQHLCAPQTQIGLHAITGDLPSRPSAWAAPALGRDPVAAVFGGALAEGVAPPLVPEWQRIITQVQGVAERMVRGQFTVDAAAREMDVVVDRLLAKRRWLLDRGRIA